MCRGTYVQIARAAWQDPKVREQLISLFLKEIDEECSGLCSSKDPSILRLRSKQDACTGVHSACRREENGHNLDICVLRRLRLSQGQMQGFLGLKVGRGGGLNLQIWDLNRPHETERTVFPILQVFSMCRCKL